MMLCDFHIHSTFSDGSLTIAEIVDLYGRRGFGAIAITDHLCEESTFLGKTARWLERTLTRETFPFYLDTIHAQAERAWRQYRMRVLPGFELTKNSLINHRSAHVVAVGVEKWISADQDIFAMLKEIRAAGGLAIAAHPVCTGKFEPQTYFLWSRRRELAPHFDAWEVASGKQLFAPVAESGLPMLANSDLHHAHHIHAWKTKLSCERHPEAIKEAVRRQRVEFEYYAGNPLLSLKKATV